MIKITLRSRGTFLSGRSLAQEILQQECSSGCQDLVELDFSGVDMATQSFVSELFVGLQRNGVDLNAVKISGVVTDTLEQRILGERARIVLLGTAGN